MEGEESNTLLNTRDKSSYKNANDKELGVPHKRGYLNPSDEHSEIQEEKLLTP